MGHLPGTPVGTGLCAPVARPQARPDVPPVAPRGHQGPRSFCAPVWLEADHCCPTRQCPLWPCWRRQGPLQTRRQWVSLLCSSQPGPGPEWHLHQHDQTDSGEVSARAAVSPAPSGEGGRAAQPHLPQPPLFTRPPFPWLSGSFLPSTAHFPVPQCASSRAPWGSCSVTDSFP